MTLFCVLQLNKTKDLEGNCWMTLWSFVSFGTLVWNLSLSIYDDDDVTEVVSIREQTVVFGREVTPYIEQPTRCFNGCVAEWLCCALVLWPGGRRFDSAKSHFIRNLTIAVRATEMQCTVPDIISQ